MLSTEKPRRLCEQGTAFSVGRLFFLIGGHDKTLPSFLLPHKARPHTCQDHVHPTLSHLGQMFCQFPAIGWASGAQSAGFQTRRTDQSATSPRLRSPKPARGRLQTPPKWNPNPATGTRGCSTRVCASVHLLVRSGEGLSFARQFFLVHQMKWQATTPLPLQSGLGPSPRSPKPSVHMASLRLRQAN